MIQRIQYIFFLLSSLTSLYIIFYVPVLSKESELLYLVKGSNCVHDKHTMCDSSSEKRCNPGITANPFICERDIVPTNMKMPKSCGY